VTVLDRSDVLAGPFAVGDEIDTLTSLPLRNTAIG
jgi:hypothetical protein